MDQAFISQAAELLIPALGGLGLAIVSWMLAEITRFVRGRTQREAITDALSRICHMVETTVAEANQVMVDDLRAVAADGHISKEDARRVKDSVLLLVKQRLAPGVLDIAAQGVSDLTAWMQARIERAVREQKQQSQE